MFKNKIVSENITEFMNQLSILSSSGISLAESLQIMQHSQENPAMQKLIQAIQFDVENKNTLSASFEKYPQYFQSFIIDILREGEKREMLAETLDKIVEYRESIELSSIDTTGKLKGAFIYPIVIAMIIFIIASILLIFVVPIFSDMFTSFGGDLPASTAFVVHLSNFFVEKWFIILAIIVAIAVYIRIETQRNSPAFLRLKSKLILYTPLIGQLYHLLASIKILRTWALLFPFKIPLPKIIAISAQVVDNQYYFDALMRVSQEVSTGVPLADSLEKQGIFQKRLIQTAAVANKVKQPEQLLIKLANIYTEKLRRLTPFYRTILEIFFLIIIGCVVGVLVIAMYSPIFKMGSVI